MEHWKSRIAVALALLTAVWWVGCMLRTSSSRTLIEFDIRQNLDLILFSDFGEPPQFAIWLEEPVSHSVRTVFVTYRSGTGDWVGKASCPVALPSWFEIYREERGTKDLPTPDAPAPDAVTGATPKEAHFKIRAHVPLGSRWICWIEVNLAGDFNTAYPQYNEQDGEFDSHFMGQPALVYRGEIRAVVGERVIPELYGQSVPFSPPGGTIQPVTDVTTAKDIFEAVEIRVVSI